MFSKSKSAFQPKTHDENRIENRIENQNELRMVGDVEMKNYYENDYEDKNVQNSETKLVKSTYDYNTLKVFYKNGSLMEIVNEFLSSVIRDIFTPEGKLFRTVTCHRMDQVNEKFYLDDGETIFLEIQYDLLNVFNLEARFSTSEPFRKLAYTTEFDLYLNIFASYHFPNGQICLAIFKNEYMKVYYPNGRLKINGKQYYENGKLFQDGKKYYKRDGTLVQE